MLPFRPAAPGHPIYPPSVAVPAGPAGEALYRLSASRSVGPWLPRPPGYFSQSFAPPYSHSVNVPLIAYYQPPGFAWRINPVPWVRPILYPVDAAHKATAASPTGIESVTPSSSQELAAQKTASPDQTAAKSSDQTVVEEEIDVVNANDIDKPLDDARAGKADSTQLTVRRPNMVRSGPRGRTIYNTHQLQIMRDRFDKRRYIEPQEAIELAYALGITVKSLNIWFSNERRRAKFTSNYSAKPRLSRNYSRRQVNDHLSTSAISRPIDILPPLKERDSR